MKRRTFLQSLVAIAIAPKILEQLAPPPAVRIRLTGYYGEGWTTADRNAGVLTIEKLRALQLTIWNHRRSPPRFDRRIYEACGALVPL